MKSTASHSGLARFVRPLALWCMVASQLVACDPEHKQKCEWYLMPDSRRIGKVDTGYIPVCARNLIVNKEDCRLQTKLEFAEKAYNRKFRYVDLKVKSYGLPRTIDQIKFCD